MELNCEAANFATQTAKEAKAQAFQEVSGLRRKIAGVLESKLQQRPW